LFDLIPHSDSFNRRRLAQGSAEVYVYREQVGEPERVDIVIEDISV